MEADFYIDIGRRSERVFAEECPSFAERLVVFVINSRHDFTVDVFGDLACRDEGDRFFLRGMRRHGQKLPIDTFFANDFFCISKFRPSISARGRC